MGYSGYLDKDSVTIFEKYQYLKEADTPAGTSIVGGLAPVPSISPEVFNEILDSNTYLILKIVDPTGVLSWPDVPPAFIAWSQSNKTSLDGIIKLIYLGFTIFCALPSPGVRQIVSAGLKAIPKSGVKAGIEKIPAEEVIKVFENTVNAILKNETLKNSVITGIDDLLSLSRSNPGIYNVLTKMKESFQKGKFNINEFTGLSESQFLAIRETAKQSELLVKGEKAFVLPKAGTDEALNFWKNIAETAAANNFAKSPKLKEILSQYNWRQLATKDFWDLSKTGLLKRGGRFISQGAGEFAGVTSGPTDVGQPGELKGFPQRVIRGSFPETPIGSKEAEKNKILPYIGPGYGDLRITILPDGKYGRLLPSNQVEIRNADNTRHDRLTMQQFETQYPNAQFTTTWKPFARQRGLKGWN